MLSKKHRKLRVESLVHLVIQESARVRALEFDDACMSQRKLRKVY